MSTAHRTRKFFLKKIPFRVYFSLFLVRGIMTYLAKPVPSLLAHFRFSDCVNMFPPPSIFPNKPSTPFLLYFQSDGPNGGHPPGGGGGCCFLHHSSVAVPRRLSDGARGGGVAGGAHGALLSPSSAAAASDNFIRGRRSSMGAATLSGGGGGGGGVCTCGGGGITGGGSPSLLHPGGSFGSVLGILNRRRLSDQVRPQRAQYSAVQYFRSLACLEGIQAGTIFFYYAHPPTTSPSSLPIQLAWAIYGIASGEEEEEEATPVRPSSVGLSVSINSFSLLP